VHGRRRGSVVIEATRESGNGPPVEVEATRGTSGTLSGSWVVDAPGRWRLRPRDPELAARAEPASLDATLDDAEFRDAESDRPLLERLAQETGGRVAGPDSAREVIAMLPNRSVVTEDPIEDSLRTSPAALAALMSLLVAEWVLRRMSRLA
jgi:hypothetical protein